MYGGLNLLVLDKISFINNKIFSFIDYRFKTIKQTYHHFFGTLDFISTSDLQQVLPIHDYWVFKPKQNSIDYLVEIFWFSCIQ